MKSTLTTIFFLFACVCLHAQAKLEFDWNTKPGVHSIQNVFHHAGHVFFNAETYQGYQSLDFNPVSGDLIRVSLGQGCDASTLIASHDQINYYAHYDGLLAYQINTSSAKLVIDDLFIIRGAGAVVSGKLFMSVAPNDSDKRLCAYDIATGTYELIDFSSAGGSANLIPTLITAHNGSVYFQGKDANNKAGLFKYEVATKNATRINSPNPNPVFGFQIRDMVSCNGGLYLIELPVTVNGLYGLSKYDDAQNMFTDELSTESLSSIVCLDQMVFGRTSKSLYSYHTVTGQKKGPYDIVPGVVDEVAAILVTDGALIVQSRAGSGSLGQYEYQPDIDQFLHLPGIFGSIDKLTKLNDTYYFADSESTLMKYKKANPVAEIAVHIGVGNLGNYYTDLGFFQDKGYLLAYDRDVIEFDTGAVANPVSLVKKYQLDSFGIKTMAILNDGIYLSSAAIQGVNYPLSRYQPGIGLKTFGAPFSSVFDRIGHMNSFQNKVYFSRYTGSTDSTLVFDPVSEQIEIAFPWAVEFSLSNGSNMYVFRDSQLYQFDANTLTLLIDSVLFVETFRVQPFILGNYLYYFTRANQNTSTYSFERMHLVTLARETYYIGEGGYELAQLVFNGKVYYSAQLLVTDRKFIEYDPQTNTVKELLVNNAPPPVWYGVGTIAALDGKMIIGLTTDQFGWELHEYNLLTTEAKLLSDIYQGNCSGYGSMTKQYGSKLYFIADDGLHGTELWSYRNCFQASISAQPSTIGLSSGSAAVQTTGGTGPFTYQWSNGATTASINNVPAGIYAVTTTDANGCQSTLSAYVDQLVSFAPEAEEMQLRVYPNPFGQRLTLEATQPLTGFGTLSAVSVQVQLLDLQGRMITSRYWESSSPLVLDGLDLPSGVYFLRLRQMSNGVMRTVKVIKN